MPEEKHEQDAKQVTTPRATNLRSMGALQSIALFAVGVGIWILIGLGIAAIFNDATRLWWKDNWLWVVVVSVAVISLAVAAQFLEHKVTPEVEAKRRAVLAVFAIPVIVLGMMTIAGLGANYMAPLLQLVLILVAAVLPAVTYYLFIVLRRPSIFNEFLANLSGLGLLSPHPVRQKLIDDDGNIRVHNGYESQEERGARIDGYLQRFESIYGSLHFDTDDERALARPKFVEKLIEAIDRRESSIRIVGISVRLRDLFRANLVIPIGLVTILTTLGWLLVLQPDLVPIIEQLRGGQPVPQSGDTTDLIAIATYAGFAFLGAYFFGIQMIFKRFVSRDLGPNTYMSFANRILLAWIATWVFLSVYEVLPILGQSGEPLPKPAMYGIVFVIGWFPRVIWQFLNALVVKIVPEWLLIPGTKTQQPLANLDGLTIWHEARLEEEDIENVPNMATVDVVDVLVHTQIPAERLVSWIDQAILYSMLGPDPEGGHNERRMKLRDLGIRSATQLAETWCGPDEDKAALKTALGDNATSSFVRAMHIESNFSVVSAWREAAKYDGKQMRGWAGSSG